VIQKLRRRHAAGFLTLAVALPVALILALAGRRQATRNATVPADPRGLATFDSSSVADIANAAVAPSTLGGSFVVGASSHYLVVAQRGEPAPDVLAYWIASIDAVATLPQDARLLGPVGSSPRRYQRPEGLGHVAFFSLAHGAVIAHALPAAN
jgi:hypothetical protein